MYRIATDFLDETALKYPDKIAFVDEIKAIRFSELQDAAMRIGTCLIAGGYWKQPVCIFLDKSVEVICAFQGVSYSGNFYCPMDTQMPKERILKIMEKLAPAAIITDRVHKDIAVQFSGDAAVFCYEDMVQQPCDKAAIRAAGERILDADILYVLFTSGSTGVPKGVIISHRGIVDLTEWIADELHFSSESIMANQSPFYFSFSVYEIYQTLRNGATTYIVPKRLFTSPAQLMQYLTDNRINTIIWVPSVLNFISTLRALDKPHCDTLQYVFFGAESMQIRHLNRWMDAYPNVRFYNLFGPTEVTDTCNYFEITRRFEEGELLPIGSACRNKDVFLLDEEDHLISSGMTDEIGEICMRGSGVAYGYYNDPERTAEAFVQNPLNHAYREIIYRLGDLGRYNDRGELVYVCRKDFQIKHKGHRIELGEIEADCMTLPGIEDVCCLYDSRKLRIVLFYIGNLTSRQITDSLCADLPEYMVPAKIVQLESMPHNLNGKTDRQALKQIIEQM